LRARTNRAASGRPGEDDVATLPLEHAGVGARRDISPVTAYFILSDGPLPER